MTLIISSIDKSFLVMTADSAITTYYSDGSTEYDSRSKSFVFPGIGCVTTWGEQIHNKIGAFFHEQEISSKHTVVDLAEITNRYLTEIYRPKDDNLDEVGYHIGGFDAGGTPRLFHVFWGYDRPRPSDQESPDYKFYDHSDWKFVYNGRNDLANVVIEKLIEQLKSHIDVRYDLSTVDGNIKFCDFVVRFAAELTPEVGPPFLTYLITRDNSIEEIKNDSFCPVNLDSQLSTKIQSKPIILFPYENDEKPQAFSLPTGVSVSKDLLNLSSAEGTVFALPYLICSSCGNMYIDNSYIPGTIYLCPVCREK